MKQILLMVLLQVSLLFSHAQLPATSQADEMKQAIADMKKEIATLEAEIKKAEKEDPGAVASLKMQLSTYKTMIAAFDKSKPADAKPKSPSAVTPNKLSQTPSPVTPVLLKQPVVAPAAAQAKDHFFWYKGRLVNDSTLVTRKGMVVQYSNKRHQLVVQQEQKKDSFVSMAKEISRGEQRKRELADRFDKMKNGFIYYPYLTTSLALYDDLTSRYADAVNNTIAFDAQRPVIAGTNRRGGNSASPGKGPHPDAPMITFDDWLPGNEQVLQWVLQQLDDAKKKFTQLPSIADFPAPPAHELGRCASCDTSLISRQRNLDENWMKAYQEKETVIFRQAVSAMREYTLQQVKDSADVVNDKFQLLVDLLMKRLQEKDGILLNRFGHNLEYLHAIIPLILGHVRQRALLGFEDEAPNDLLAELAGKTMKVYWKYYDEQVGLRNHDFVLNIPFHIGVFRQMALLGNEDDQRGGVAGLMQRTIAYNRFALTMEMDFVWQREADGELELRATGSMGTPDKIYTLLYPDSCSYRMIAYTTDLNNKNFDDITIPLKVRSGVKTVKEDNGKLKDYPYQGPPEYAFRFPDSRIEFCSNTPDTLFLALVGGGEEVAARAEADMQNIHKAYTIDMLMYAGQVLINEDANEMVAGTQDAGNDILNSIAGFMQQAGPRSTLEKLKMQYEGYMKTDNLRKGFEGAYTTQTAKILFNANNRSTVLADQYTDTKRRMTDDVEVKKGLFHLRLVHEPMK